MGWLFLFGAGASHGSGPCAPKMPPLGGRVFEELQELGGEAANVDDDLAAVFSRDFEKGMDHFYRDRKTRVSALLREMAAYFAQFEPLSGNFYVELLTTLKKARRKATFATLNYDVILELAVRASGLRTAYHGFPVPPDNVPILKIHGSCNFWPDPAAVQFRGIVFDAAPGCDGPILEAPMRIARSSAEILRWCEHEDSIAPALALYARSKSVLYCPMFIEKQRSDWLTAVARATAVYVIGVRVHTSDHHVWDPLATTRAPIYYVGRQRDAFIDWASRRRVAKRKSYVLAESFEAALPLIAHHGQH
jgi:hypothetical protein